MRKLLLSAAALTLIAGAASAQPALTRTRPVAPPGQAGAPPQAPQADLPPDVSTVAADLSGLNTRITQDEVRMTALRDWELGQENKVITHIRPALKFHGRSWFPAKY